MGFAVIQGYGLTETAPIVTLNHPFKTSKGSVGTPIAGVEIRIADDGEILVRGENVTCGYYDGARSGEARSPGHRASTPRLAAHRRHRRTRRDGRLFIKGRKKEMIVTPEGLNVFPEDVERVLDELPGVRESAVVGVATGRARSECTRCSCSSRRRHPTIVTAGQRPSAGPPADPRRLGLAGERAAAHGGDAQAETRARCASGWLSGAAAARRRRPATRSKR